MKAIRAEAANRGCFGYERCPGRLDMHMHMREHTTKIHIDTPRVRTHTPGAPTHPPARPPAHAPTHKPHQADIHLFGGLRWGLELSVFNGFEIGCEVISF